MLPRNSSQIDRRRFVPLHPVVEPKPKYLSEPPEVVVDELNSKTQRMCGNQQVYKAKRKTASLPAVWQDLAHGSSQGRDQVFAIRLSMYTLPPRFQHGMLDWK